MATPSVANRSVKVPKHLLTSDSCVVVPAGNAHTFPGGTRIEAGEDLVFDLTKCPKHGDIVLMKRKDRAPFVRECYIAPLELQQREDWCMLVQGEDPDELCEFMLGEYEWVGVMTGKVPQP